MTVYLHIGDKLMPKSYATVPRPGEIVEVSGSGRLVVVAVELDADGDAHLYLQPAGEADLSSPHA